MNTRTYPRTLGEAFKGVEYASAVERPAPSYADKAVAVALALGAVAAVLSAVLT